MRLLPVLVILCACAGAAPAAQEEVALPQLEKRISHSLRGKLEDHAAKLREALGINLVMDSAIKDQFQDAERELVLTDVKGSTALHWLTAIYRLEYTVGDGVVLIGPRGRHARPVAELYDVRPLLVSPKDESGGEMRQMEGGGRLEVPAEEKRAFVEINQIMDLIRYTVNPGSWEGEYSVDVLPNMRILVTHLPAVQKKVRKLLETLGSMVFPTVTISAEIVEADEDSSSLLHPGSTTTFFPAEVGKVLEQIRASRQDGRARALQATALTNQRVHARLMEEGTGGGFEEGCILDVRPTLVSNGEFVHIELRLSLEQTSDLDAPAGKLRLKESTMTRLETTLLIPNGGGVLFSLPARRSAEGRPQLCLLRASSFPPPPLPSLATFGVEEERSDRAGLAERLAKLPRASIDMKEAPFEEFVKWLRTTSGMNVVVDEAVTAGHKVSLSCTGLPVDVILRLALQQAHLSHVLGDEAIFLTTGESDRRMNVQLGMLDVRDIVADVRDFPAPTPILPEEAPAARSQYAGEDLAKLMVDTVEPGNWEEADGAFVSFQNGALIIRNTPEIVRKCARFIEEVRRESRRLIGIRADTMLIPARSADAILDRTSGESGLIDEKEYEALAGAGVFLERLGWHGHDGQRTAMVWTRQMNLVADSKTPPETASGTSQASSYLDVRATLQLDGRSILLDLKYDDWRWMETKGREAAGLPLLGEARGRATLVIPEGKMAVFRWSAPPKENGERQYRLLILKPVAWSPKGK